MARERATASTPDGDYSRAVLEAAIAAVPAALRVDGCAVLLAHAERATLRAVARRNLSEPQAQALAELLNQPEAAALLAAGQPLLPRTGEGLSAASRSALQTEGWPDLIAVPLPGTGRPAGALVAVPDGDGRWSPARIDSAMRLGALLAASLRAAVRATEGERRGRRAISLLERLPLLRDSALDTDGALGTVVTALGQALGLSHCLGLLVAPVTAFAEFCQPGATPIGPPTAPEEHLMWRPLRQGALWAFDDAEASAADRSATARMLGGRHTRSLLAVPIRHGDALIGAVLLIQAERRRPFTDDERAFAAAAAAELTAALSVSPTRPPVALASEADGDLTPALTALAAAHDADQIVRILESVLCPATATTLILVGVDQMPRRLHFIAGTHDGVAMSGFPDAPLGDDLVSEAVRLATPVRGSAVQSLPRSWRRVYRPQRGDHALVIPVQTPSDERFVLAAIGPDHAALAHATPVAHALALQAGVGLACLTLGSRAELREARLTALNEVLLVTAAAVDVAAACREVTTALARALPDTALINIWLLDEAGDTLERVSMSGPGLPLAEMADHISLSVDAGATRAVRDGRTQVWQAGDTHAPALARALMARIDLQTLVTVPMRTVERITGVLTLGSRTQRIYSRDELTFLETLAGQLGGQLALVRALQRAENERSRLASLLATLPEGIIVIDAESRVALHNAAADNLVCDQLDGRTLTDLLTTMQVMHMDGRPMAQEELPLVRALGGEVAVGIELLVMRPDGTEIPLLVNAGPVRDARGAISGSVAIFQDLTSHQELSVLKDDFVNTVSHELRTPVTTIRGGALTLLKRRQFLDDQTQSDLLSDIAEEAERLHVLVEDLLALSRSRRGIAVSTEPILFHRLVNRVILELGGRVGSHALVVNVPPNLPPVEADPDLTRQVLRNLLENAVKFSPRGQQVEVAGELRDGAVMVSVLDRGSGIPAQDMDRVFEPFYRTDDSKRSGAQGAGLGLAVCRRLVEMQGGRIWAEPREGGGAAFHFTLPIAMSDE